jgi:8-oxo-dGTP diphosphatase
MTSVIYKVFAYITHQNRLLVFRHTDFPEAGIQVPAGTVMPNEDLSAAVLREAQEETGLRGLRIKTCLGEQIRNMEDVGKDEIHHRHFYHLLCEGDPPEQWQHDETDPSDGGSSPIRFEFFWAEIPHQIPELIADHGFMLPILEKLIK